VTRLNYDYPDEEHVEWSVAARYKGQTLKEWVRRALNKVAADEKDERDAAERRRRSR